MQKLKTQKGITLIALVITIIVMLILVGVSVTVALNGGLFNTAKKAKTDTQGAISAEQKLDDGRIKIDGQWYASIQDYIDKNPILMGIELSKPTITLKKKASADEVGQEVLTATITATPFGMDKEPEVLWETDPKEQEVIELSKTTGKTIIVRAKGTEKAIIKLIAKCTYEDKTYTEECTINLEIIQELTQWAETTKPDTWVLADGTINPNVQAMTNGTYTIPLPTGYTISNDENEKKVTKGLVITDGENEFVWIPVAAKNFTNPYPNSSSASEPIYHSKVDSKSGAPSDSQTTLDYYYWGYTIDPSSANENGIATNTTPNGTTFDYGYHYHEMVTSVNKYGGFYVGRYETTIDSSNHVGCKEGTSVLISGQYLPQIYKGTRWWGLYALQRSSNVKGNGSIVQTNMIWAQQWDAMVKFFGSVNGTSGSGSVSTLATSGKQNAGQAKYTDGGKTISDKICNIYDLRGNVLDWSAGAVADGYTRSYGGSYKRRQGYTYTEGYQISGGFDQYTTIDEHGSRMTLYIK